MMPESLRNSIPVAKDFQEGDFQVAVLCKVVLLGRFHTIEASITKAKELSTDNYNEYTNTGGVNFRYNGVIYHFVADWLQIDYDNGLR